MKTCKKCGKAKPLGEFYRMAGMRDGHRNECKRCNLDANAARHRANPEPARERTRQWARDNPERVAARLAEYRASGRKGISDRRSYLKRKYGITPEHYDALLAEQEGGCAICERPPTPGISLHVDHDHATGDIRGLLCFRCNNALGDFDDDHDRLAAALRYLGPVPKDEATTVRLAALMASSGAASH
jgi:hypothetical protein